MQTSDPGDGHDPGSGQGPRVAGQGDPTAPNIYGNVQSDLPTAEVPGSSGEGGSSSSSANQPQDAASFAELVASLDDPVELAALVKLQTCDQIEPGKFTVEQVLGVITWALETDAHSASDSAEMVETARDSQQSLSSDPKMEGRRRYRAACSIVAFLLVVFCAYFGLSAAVHILTQEASVDENGVLLVPRDDGRSTVVTTGSAVVLRDLLSYPALAASELRHVKDAVFVHKGTWHCVRVVRTVKYSNHHVVLHSHDGSAVRVRDGNAYFQNIYGPWELIDIAESEKYASRLDQYEARWLVKGAFVTDTMAAPVGYSVPPFGVF